MRVYDENVDGNDGVYADVKDVFYLDDVDYESDEVTEKYKTLIMILALHIMCKV